MPATNYSTHATIAHQKTSLMFRVRTIAVILAVWMLIVLLRLVYLQVYQYDWIIERARTQQQQVVETDSARGLIVDRAGIELARSINTKSFFAVPDEIPDIDAAAKKLGAILNQDGKEISDRIRKAKNEGRKFFWIARQVEASKAALIDRAQLIGLYSRDELKRYYPNDSLAAHVLGFVGVDDVGLAGVEKAYNEKLNGRGGEIYLDTDGAGRTYGSIDASGDPGKVLVLTIDQTIQHWTEQALVSARERTHARSAAAIVLDPRTGDILALANAPTFNPNLAHLINPQERINGALQNIYEPGSTLKIVTYSAAIEEKIARPDELIDCQMGEINIYGRVVHDHKPFGLLSVAEALEKSSNVAAIKLGMRVGDVRLYNYLTRFGFGLRTGIELPGETRGLLRPLTRWSRTSIGSIAIGQEIGVTPLQMVAAFGALANDGIRITPHLVKEVHGGDGEVLFRAAPTKRRVISADTAKTLRGMLEGVTLNGTAKLAQLDGYSAAGKTGTAQKIDPRTRSYSATKYVASFVGFAPVAHPAVVIIVVVDEPQGGYHGGDVAAPVFREIAEHVLPKLEVAPDIKQMPPQKIGEDRDLTLALRSNKGEKSEVVNTSTTSVNAGNTANDSLPQVLKTNSANDAEIVYALSNEKGILMPDLRGHSLRDVARICAQLGLQIEAKGDGRASLQNPAAGTQVEYGRVVQVLFTRDD